MNCKKLVYRSLVVLLVFCQMSCDVINPEEEIPSYLKIESFDIIDNSNVDEVSLKSKIVAANVIVNNETAGVIMLPGKIPVFAEGDVTVTLDPLVQENGSQNTMQIYPFLERIDVSANLTRRDSTTIEANTQYRSSALVVGSSFSGADEFFTEELDGNGFTQLSISSVGGQVGEGSVGRIILNEANPVFEAATNSSSPINVTNLRLAWLEVQYKTDVDLLFGVKTSSNEILREFGVKAKDEWNTIYFDASSFLISQDITSFQLTLTANLPGTWSSGDAEILLDNVKFVYSIN